MKRSNRLILLIGVVLAIIAFVAIVILFQGNATNTGGGQQQITELNTVKAAVDIPLGTQVRQEQLKTEKVKVEERAADAIGDDTLVVGRIIRTDVIAGSQITQSMFATSGLGVSPVGLLDKGQRAVTVQVDQISGVGTLINVGDHVDAVVGFGGAGCGAAFQVVTVDKQTGQLNPVTGLSTISVKLLLQNMKVVSTLLPPVQQTTNAGAQASPAPGTGGTALNGQQEIVGLAVSAQQSEIIKYAQIDGCISLALRSPKDYVDDAGNPVTPPPDATTGVILKTLVDEYGVIPPEVVEGVLPKK